MDNAWATRECESALHPDARGLRSARGVTVCLADHERTRAGCCPAASCPPRTRTLRRWDWPAAPRSDRRSTRVKGSEPPAAAAAQAHREGRWPTRGPVAHCAGVIVLAVLRAAGAAARACVFVRHERASGRGASASASGGGRRAQCHATAVTGAVCVARQRNESASPQSTPACRVATARTHVEPPTDRVPASLRCEAAGSRAVRTAGIARPAEKKQSNWTERFLARWLDALFTVVETWCRWC